MLSESPEVQLDLVINEVDAGSVESLTGEDASGGGDIVIQDCLNGTQPESLSSDSVGVDNSLGHALRRTSHEHQPSRHRKSCGQGAVSVGGEEESKDLVIQKILKY